MSIASSSNTAPPLSPAGKPLPNTSYSTVITTQEQYEVFRSSVVLPSILPWEIFIDLDKRTVDGLCAVGRELVQDLHSRAIALLSIFRSNVAKSSNNTNSSHTEAVLTYAHFLLETLAEICLLIDKKRNALNEFERISDDNIIAAFADPTPPPENPQKTELSKQFDQNRKKIIKINNKLKHLEFLSLLLDPHIIELLQQKNDNTDNKRSTTNI